MSHDAKAIKYITRDGKGNDIVKDVKIKQFPVFSANFSCAVCGEKHEQGCKVRDIISGSFTDFSYLRSDYVCTRCADLFSLYFYSYIVDPDGIRLLNVRELSDALQKQQKTPFLFCITISKKKHLFYRAVWNYSPGRFAVNLETETIYTTTERMRTLFDLVESMQTIGAPKSALSCGELPFSVVEKIGISTARKVIDCLRDEISKSREIQIPLFCGQKRDISEEEAICCINSTLITMREQRQRC